MTLAKLADILASVRKVFSVDCHLVRDKIMAWASRLELKLVRCGSVRYHAESLNDCTAAKRLAIQLAGSVLADSPVEKLVVVTLDSSNKPIGVHVVTEGTLNASLVHPREVFAHCVLAGAAAFILVHNHPSGELTPSREDIAVTSRMAECGRLMGIQMHDHIIIGWHPMDEQCNALSLREFNSECFLKG